MAFRVFGNLTKNFAWKVRLISVRNEEGAISCESSAKSCGPCLVGFGSGQSCEGLYLSPPFCSVPVSFSLNGRFLGHPQPGPVLKFSKKGNLTSNLLEIKILPAIEKCLSFTEAFPKPFSLKVLSDHTHSCNSLEDSQVVSWCLPGSAIAYELVRNFWNHHFK